MANTKLKWKQLQIQKTKKGRVPENNQADQKKQTKSPNPYSNYVRERDAEAVKKNVNEQQNQNALNSSIAPVISHATPKISSPGKIASSSSPSSSSEAHISSSDILKFQRLIKPAIDAGLLRRKCTTCGNSIPDCCEQNILKAVSDLLALFTS
ncbi:uncharacterized protein LOC120004537 [Tripterygium wilfordii]|uniref:uncharacterized protein LOC120004537 n=1 Tax=Tripterygium wilfordii TaxID=458696 RepID=UPI0018F81BD5|nr:uncharacterized protein LOC120004537 [Tripterygium wilfordii]